MFERDVLQRDTLDSGVTMMINKNRFHLQSTFHPLSLRALNNVCQIGKK